MMGSLPLKTLTKKAFAFANIVEKKKMLLASIFSIYHNVFYSQALEALWFDLWSGKNSLLRLMIFVATGFIPLTTIHCFDDDCPRQQPVAWKEILFARLVKRTQRKHE